MQFKVPQDVQREDTIVGPLTLKQLIIMAIGGGTAYAIYVTLATRYFFEVWLPPVAIVVIITILFAFVKPNGLPFYVYIMNFIEYHFLPKKRVWIHRSANPFIPPEDNSKKTIAIKEEKKKPEKSLEELSAILDTAGESEMLKKVKTLHEQPK